MAQPSAKRRIVLIGDATGGGNPLLAYLQKWALITERENGINVMDFGTPECQPPAYILGIDEVFLKRNGFTGDLEG